MQTNDLISRFNVAGLQNDLLNWFQCNKRTFPWRETSNPFHILIAEKLLQQTSAGERVVNAYRSIVEHYPDPRTLASARIEDFSKLFEPLGLLYRAQELIKLASVLEEQFQSRIPTDYISLIKLPGVGEYTARAILCFAYNQDIAIVDTNVARVLFRVFDFFIPMPANPARKKSILELATTLLPEGRSREFNFALLDFSAIICKSEHPICHSCPIFNFCFFSRKSHSYD